MEELRLEAGTDGVGQRIDRYLAEETERLTRSAVQTLCGEGLVAVNGKPVAKNYRLREGDVVVVSLPPPKELEALPQNIPLDIVYEDDHLLVVNKPKGMVVHPAAGNESGTLVNALLYHCGGNLSGINGVARPGIVHRIDKDTSGLLLVAKTDLAHQGLSDQIREHSVAREYAAVVYGNVKTGEGTVDAPLARHPVDRKRMAVTGSGGREARTHYRVEERYQGFTALGLRLETGRTHQIRVHMAYIGHPVAGDPVYGPKKVIGSLGGQCLHARMLGFVHPAEGRYLEFTAPLPESYRRFVSGLRPWG